jgi:hypothetical protein
LGGRGAAMSATANLAMLIAGLVILAVVVWAGRNL